jgi:hypothetical protein
MQHHSRISRDRATAALMDVSASGCYYWTGREDVNMRPDWMAWEEEGKYFAR